MWSILKIDIWVKIHDLYYWIYIVASITAYHQSLLRCRPVDASIHLEIHARGPGAVNA